MNAMRAALWAFVLLAVQACASLQEMPSAPAHWVNATNWYQPVSSDFTFDALSFSTPDDGWIVGNRFLLHLRNGEPEVVFASRSRVWFHSAHFLHPTEGWTGGFMNRRGESEGVIWRHRDRNWEVSETSGVALRDWSVDRVSFSSSRDGWATATVRQRDETISPPPGQVTHLAGELLHFDGMRWTVDQSRPTEGRRWNVIDMCLEPNGDGWFVGTNETYTSPVRPLMVALRNGRWLQSALPDVETPHAVLTDVVCLGEHVAVAAGWVSRDPRGSGTAEGLLLRFTGTWERIPLPDDLRSSVIEALSAVSDRNIWIAVSCADPTERCRPRFLHWVDGQWADVSAPVLPELRVGGYSVTDMQFVSPDEGWAIANDYGGPGLVRGLVFHYKDGVWRNRNWNWHFWDQPWFGLFGD